MTYQLKFSLLLILTFLWRPQRFVSCSAATVSHALRQSPLRRVIANNSSQLPMESNGEDSSGLDLIFLVVLGLAAGILIFIFFGAFFFRFRYYRESRKSLTEKEIFERVAGPASRWDLESLLHPPSAIDYYEGRDIRRFARALLGESDDQVRVFLTYGLGNRAEDWDACGPGMFLATAVLKCLYEHKIKCFCDLMLPRDVPRDVLAAKLASRQSSCDVLIVLQTKALYECEHCLSEIFAALSSELQIVPLRFEGGLPLVDYQWPQIRSANIDGTLMRSQVQQALSKFTSIPAPPSTVADQPSVLNGLALDLSARLNMGSPSCTPRACKLGSEEKLDASKSTTMLLTAGVDNLSWREARTPETLESSKAQSSHTASLPWREVGSLEMELADTQPSHGMSSQESMLFALSSSSLQGGSASLRRNNRDFAFTEDCWASCESLGLGSMGLSSMPCNESQGFTALGSIDASVTSKSYLKKNCSRNSRKMPRLAKGGRLKKYVDAQSPQASQSVKLDASRRRPKLGVVRGNAGHPTRGGMHREAKDSSSSGGGMHREAKDSSSSGTQSRQLKRPITPTADPTATHVLSSWRPVYTT